MLSIYSTTYTLCFIHFEPQRPQLVESSIAKDLSIWPIRELGILPPDRPVRRMERFNHLSPALLSYLFSLRFFSFLFFFFSSTYLPSVVRARFSFVSLNLAPTPCTSILTSLPLVDAKLLLDQTPTVYPFNQTH